MSCQLRRRLFVSSAKEPLPPSCPVLVVPVAKPYDNGSFIKNGYPPMKPPPPIPSKRPFQPLRGKAIHTFTLSFAGGWFTITVTLQALSFESTTADTMVALGMETFIKSPQLQIGFTSP